MMRRKKATTTIAWTSPRNAAAKSGRTRLRNGDQSEELTQRTFLAARMPGSSRSPEKRHQAARRRGATGSYGVGCRTEKSVGGEVRRSTWCEARRVQQKVAEVPHTTNMRARDNPVYRSVLRAAA